LHICIYIFIYIYIHTCLHIFNYLFLYAYIFLYIYLQILGLATKKAQIVPSADDVNDAPEDVDPGSTFSDTVTGMHLFHLYICVDAYLLTL
jgi:hypothetical protein